MLAIYLDLGCFLDYDSSQQRANFLLSASSLAKGLLNGSKMADVDPPHRIAPTADQDKESPRAPVEDTEAEPEKSRKMADKSTFSIRIATCCGCGFG